MATLLQRATLAANQAFLVRTMMAAVIVSLEVFAESDDTYEHLARLAFARLVLASPQDQQIRLVVVVLTSDKIVNAEIAAAGSSLDADILDQVRINWTQLSGMPNE